MFWKKYIGLNKVGKNENLIKKLLEKLIIDAGLWHKKEQLLKEKKKEQNQ
jgi:hypothetical protein